MTQTKTYELLAAEIVAMEIPTAEMTLGAADVCATWARVRGPVTQGVAILRLLPMAWAKKVADALAQLVGVLDMLCPR